MAELLPCPFCGGKKWTYIQCEGYQKSTSRTGKSSSSNSQADAQVDTLKEGGANCPLQP